MDLKTGLLSSPYIITENHIYSTYYELNNGDRVTKEGVYSYLKDARTYVTIPSYYVNVGDQTIIKITICWTLSGTSTNTTITDIYISTGVTEILT